MSTHTRVALAAGAAAAAMAGLTGAGSQLETRFAEIICNEVLRKLEGLHLQLEPQLQPWAASPDSAALPTITSKFRDIIPLLRCNAEDSGCSSGGGGDLLSQVRTTDNVRQCLQDKVSKEEDSIETQTTSV
uniref:Rx N-terminal domain-containing protein n=1 Tax=Oryza nivara TaxID=4536 RepID=A0A0E0ICN4_ORYNI